MAHDDTKSGSPSGAGQPPPGPSRIHVDSDWKKEAQAEKERLSRQIEGAGRPAAGPAATPGAESAPGVGGAAAPAPAPAPGAGARPAAAAPHGGPRQLPPATFATLVQTLATQAAIFLSDQPDPETGEPLRHLELAKHNIDLLGVLEEKTKGNLTDAERQLLDRFLYELQMAYISAAS